MEQLHTTAYDAQIMKELKHLQQYPEMLPFIGQCWQENEKRLLLLGESHYIDGPYLASKHSEETHQTDWYSNSSKNFDSYLAPYINTRNVVHISEHPKEYKRRKPLAIYYNIKTAIKEHDPALRREEHIFQYVSLYNYFQRPAFEQKESIDNNTIDNAVAYETLKKLVSIIQPKKIIFVSRKAYVNFCASKQKDVDASLFSSILIDNVPHPSCAWWNKKSNALGGKTGKQKFLHLLASNH